jgi:hypothetical protein
MLGGARGIFEFAKEKTVFISETKLILQENATKEQ